MLRAHAWCQSVPPPPLRGGSARVAAAETSMTAHGSWWMANSPGVNPAAKKS